MDDRLKATLAVLNFSASGKINMGIHLESLHKLFSEVNHDTIVFFTKVNYL